MFPQCSLDVPNIATLRKHSANIRGILRACWVMHVEECYFEVYHSVAGYQQHHEIQHSLTDVFHYQRTI